MQTVVLKEQSHKQWYADVSRLRTDLESDPSNLDLANRYWMAISGKSGFDVRDANRAMKTFQVCGLQSNEGLASLVSALREIADETGELPRPGHFPPPLENLLQSVAGDSSHSQYEGARWILGIIDPGC